MLVVRLFPHQLVPMVDLSTETAKSKYQLPDTVYQIAEQSVRP